MAENKSIACQPLHTLLLCVAIPINTLLRQPQFIQRLNLHLPSMLLIRKHPADPPGQAIQDRLIKSAVPASDVFYQNRKPAVK